MLHGFRSIAASLSLFLIAAVAVSGHEFQAPTVRSILSAMHSTDLAILPADCLDTPVSPSNNERFIQIACHINPSAEDLLVFTRAADLAGVLFGWTLATLPNDFIVYHNAEVHFAATHSLGISVFDPTTRSDRKIYPPMPYQPVRAAFIERVRAVYKSRGEEWFRQHNHAGDPEFFDSRLDGDVRVDIAAKQISFRVAYGDPDNANDPLPFSERVQVRCGPIDVLEQMRCFESAERQ